MILNDYNFKTMEKGSGTPVVFVHGSVSDYRTWPEQVDFFSKNYRAIAYSRRFHWPNEPIVPGQDYAMDVHVDDLLALLDKLGEPAHLVGHSYGAFVGLIAATKRPGLFQSLVLAEPPVITLFVGGDPKPTELLRLLFIRPKTALALIRFAVAGVEPAKKALKRGDTERAIAVFGKATLGKDAFLALSPERMEQVRDNFIEAEFTGSGFPPVEDEAVRNLSIPTLLLQGESSPALFHRIVDRLEQLLPVAGKKVIEGASHIVYEDNPMAFFNAVKGFLEYLSPGRSPGTASP